MTAPPSPDLATRLHAVSAQIRDTARKATPSPWFAQVNDLIGGACVMPIDKTAAEGSALGYVTIAESAWPANATFIASMSPDIAALIADVMDRVANNHRDKGAGYCAACGDSTLPCLDLTLWLPLVEAFEARR